MRTLLFTLEYPPQIGGIASYYSNLGSHWPLGEDFLVLDNGRDGLIKKRHFLPWWPAVMALWRKIKKSRIDYVLVGHILPLGTAAWLVSWLQPMKYGVFLHGLDFSAALRTPRKKFLSMIIMKRADKVIAANSYVADQAREMFPYLAGKIVVINPGVFGATPHISETDKADLLSKYGLIGQNLIFSLGRLVKRKGFDRVIQALASLPIEQAGRFTYVIAGDGPQRDYLRRLVPSSWRNRVIFLGKITETEKWIWLSVCDIFIMASRDIAGDFEGFGIVYLEANLCGKPVIAGNSGGVKDAVVDGQNGLIADSEDIYDIKEKILKLADNPELREKLGRIGKERAIKEFSWEKQAARVCEAIKGEKKANR